MTIRVGGERLARLAMPVGAGERDGTSRKRPRRPALRWAGLVWLGAFLLLLANDPGRMFFETKLSVDLDPAGFYASLWHLMDPRNTFSALNNQAIGYAMPMGPFYLAGHLAHVPVWLTERLWLSLIIAVGFAGLVKLAEALDIGSPASRLLAGLVFALWPTFTIVIGSTSSAVLPGMLAPWAVLPLTTAVRGRGSVIWPAARSGAVVLCMSGVNATVTIEALLLPGLFILSYARGRRLVALALCWAGAVAMATAWWALPLLLQGKYAFNFLPYVEQASTTTGTVSAAATLRGAGNWTAYLSLGTPWLPAGWAMVSTPMAIIVGAVAAACGLYGLALRSMPGAVWLRLSAGLAAAVELAGYSGSLGGPFHQAADHLLDGTLAPFRNVYKLEPVIAAALALGLAHAVATWLAHTPGRRPSPVQRVFTLEARAVVGVVLVGLMLPYLSGQVLNPGSFSAVPRYWYQVAAFLAARSPHNTAVVVPADTHGTYLWGDPIDDPLVALAKSPWAQRGLVPYGGAGSQILLDTVEKAVESGERVSGLAGYLQRAGVRYLVVRNDLDPRQVGYTSAALVHQSLALSGFTRAASFGSSVGGAQIEPRATRAQQAALPSYPAVEVYAPAGSSGTPSPVSTLPVSQTVLLNGGPDSLLQLTGQHLLGAGQPAIIAGDPLPAEARAVGGHRRAAPGRHAVRLGQCQRLLYLHRDRGQPGRRRPARPGERTAPGTAASATRRAPDRGRAVWRGERDRIVLRLLDRRHPAGRPGQRLRRQPGDGLGRRRRADASRAVDPDRPGRPAGPAGQRRDTPAGRQLVPGDGQRGPGVHSSWERHHQARRYWRDPAAEGDPRPDKLAAHHDRRSPGNQGRISGHRNIGRADPRRPGDPAASARTGSGWPAGGLGRFVLPRASAVAVHLRRPGGHPADGPDVHRRRPGDPAGAGFRARRARPRAGRAAKPDQPA